jgi:hypothetical protein
LPHLRKYNGFCEGKLKKTTKKLRQDRRCIGPDSNLTPHEYKSEALLLEAACSARGKERDKISEASYRVRASPI